MSLVSKGDRISSWWSKAFQTNMVHLRGRRRTRPTLFITKNISLQTFITVATLTNNANRYIDISSLYLANQSNHLLTAILISCPDQVALQSNRPLHFKQVPRSPL